MATVKVIPPRKKQAEHLRVAAYCRVSSDSADQLHSCVDILFFKLDGDA